MREFKKIILIVMDSLGVGEAIDASLYNDAGANTFGHIVSAYPDIKIPNLEKLGMKYFVDKESIIDSLVCKLEEISVGKDTLTGHFEMMGLKVDKSFPSFTETGFPKELIDKLEAYSKRKVIGNISASGTEIIKDLGEEQLRTGALIVYTSADSVLQIAANEEIIPLSELYDICAYARKITIENPEWMVGRIIARPFVGTNKDNFTRTANRHDYALKPFDKTVLNTLQENGFDSIAVGKINDIFDNYGITEYYYTKSNKDGMVKTIDIAQKDFKGLCFTNLVDFDALFGHRRDVFGYKKAIEEFDIQLGELLKVIDDNTLLMITADHGNDPIHHGTDHTRENVPLLIYYNGVDGKYLGEFKSFTNIGSTITANFNLPKCSYGEGFNKYFK